MVDLTQTIVNRIKERYEQARILLQGPSDGQSLMLDENNESAVVGSVGDTIGPVEGVEDRRIDSTISHADLIQLDAYRVDPDLHKAQQGVEMAARWQASDDAVHPDEAAPTSTPSPSN